VSAALFLVEPEVLGAAEAGSLVVLDGAEGRHATVKRVTVGEPVLLSDGAGRLAEAVTEWAGPGEVRARVLAKRQVPEPSPRFVLVQALAKGDRDEQAVEAATELGVDEVVAWQASRSVVVWRGERAERSRRRWQQVVRAAAKQSRRSRVPPVSGPADQGDVIHRIVSADLAVVLHEEATDALAGVPLPAAGEVLVVV